MVPWTRTGSLLRTYESFGIFSWLILRSPPKDPGEREINTSMLAEDLVTTGLERRYYLYNVTGRVTSSVGDWCTLYTVHPTSLI